MNLLSTTTSKKFSLLTFGRRGVGKTIFLVGSYAELHSYSTHSQQDNPHQLWFDCQDSEVQAKVENILRYITYEGIYPPPTMKITTFDFSMKRQSRRGIETLAHFRWWDIPGEYCDFANTNFRTMVLNSNGCCVFIDAFELVHNHTYLQELEKDVFPQVKTLASLVSLNYVKYRFAVILTKCDLLKLDLITNQRLEEGLQSLTNHFDAAKVNYKTFYSRIPIFSLPGVTIIRPKGAAAPLLWLVEELSKVHNPGLMNNIRNLFTRDRKSGFPRQQEAIDDLLHLINPAGKASKSEKLLKLYLFPITRKYILLTVVIGLVGVVGLSLMKYKLFRQHEPNYKQPGTDSKVSKVFSSLAVGEKKMKVEG